MVQKFVSLLQNPSPDTGRSASCPRGHVWPEWHQTLCSRRWTCSVILQNIWTQTEGRLEVWDYFQWRMNSRVVLRWVLWRRVVPRGVSDGFLEVKDSEYSHYFYNIYTSLKRRGHCVHIISKQEKPTSFSHFNTTHKHLIDNKAASRFCFLKNTGIMSNICDHGFKMTFSREWADKCEWWEL